MTPHVLLVPDCGTGVGLGHLERMLALADALRPDLEVSVVVPLGEAWLGRRVLDRGHRAVVAPGAPAERAEAVAGHAVPPDLIVLDGYVFDVALQRRLRERARLVVVDDLGLPSACDLAVNPSPAGDRMRPDGAGAFIGGADYALLGRAFLDARATAESRDQPPRTVLVSTGSMNLKGINSDVAAILLESHATVEVVVVVGPEMRAGDLPAHPRLQALVAPPSLAGALASVTVFAGAAGTTAVQAACVGVPAVITPAVDNQIAQAAALVAAGCAVAAEPAAMAHESLRLLDDDARLREMSMRGRSLVDGHGAGRVAGALRRLVGLRAA